MIPNACQPTIVPVTCCQVCLRGNNADVKLVTVGKDEKPLSVCFRTACLLAARTAWLLAAITAWLLAARTA